jgi:hypothetical protein
MSEQVVDLDQILDLSGLAVADSYQAGRQARAILRLEELDRAEGKVVVRAPADVTSMSTPFLIGLLQPSVEHFGSRQGFLDHYEIDGNPSLVSQIQRAIAYSLLPDTKSAVVSAHALIGATDPGTESS